MKTFLPSASFIFPEGSIIRFEAGVMSLPIADEEAALLEAKGLGSATSIESASSGEQPASPYDLTGTVVAHEEDSDAVDALLGQVREPEASTDVKGK
ncbi:MULTISPECIES: hypothetical protein [unclassified Rhizobium]